MIEGTILVYHAKLYYVGGSGKQKEDHFPC